MNKKEKDVSKSLKIRLTIITLTVASQVLVLGGANARAVVESPITFDEVNINVIFS